MPSLIIFHIMVLQQLANLLYFFRIIDINGAPLELFGQRSGDGGDVFKFQLLYYSLRPFLVLVAELDNELVVPKVVLRKQRRLLLLLHDGRL